MDALCGNVMENTLKEMFPMHLSFLSSYPDFFACFIVLLLTGNDITYFVECGTFVA